MNKLYSASEIAAMNLPGLPATKKAILTRAEKEDWYFETKIGLGGVRKMFKIPRAYLPGYTPPNANAEVLTLREAQERQIIESAEETARTAPGLVNHSLLVKAIVEVDMYQLNNKVRFTTQRHAEIVSIVYAFMQGNEDKEAVANLIKLVA